ncbi:DUF6252 family protein [Flavobacterium sp.]|uniref:DUF6252 family protein n=1 Tax=Flavobacterium sp. TaxID=239 RepID=UPI0040333CF7
MKTIYKTVMVLIAATTLLTSCSDDSDGNTGGNTPSGTYISAKVGGSTFETLSQQGFNAASATKQVIGDDTFITITATSGNTNTMVITLMGITATGTYDVGPASENAVAFFDTATETAFASSADCAGAEGELKVTHYSAEKIEGTFTFTGKSDDDCSQSKTVTQGKFRGIYAN